MKVTVSKTARCPVCERTTRRSRTFSTWDQAQAWKRDVDGTHDRCRLAQQAAGA